MAGGDMLPLPPHFHPLQELWPSLFTPSALSLPSQQLAESLFDVAGFAVFATLYAFAISFVFPCPPHQPLLLGKMSLQMRRSDGSAVAARPNSIRLPPPQRLRNSLLLSPIAPRYINFAGVMGVLWPLALIASGYYLRKSIPEFTWALSLVLPDMLLLVIQVISEGVTVVTKQSLPVKALVPPLYNARRMFSLYKWLTHSAAAVLPLILSSTARAGSGSVWRLVWLGALVACAAVNYLLWAYNIFCFLLPTVVPRIFEQDITSRAAASGTDRVEAVGGSSGGKGKKGGKSL
ncbi:unnamed protein product [Closterium sp. NIES-64]|nr:unnamed protein product [Closterium sp. NIES-64]